MHVTASTEYISTLIPLLKMLILTPLLKLSVRSEELMENEKTYQI